MSQSNEQQPGYRTIEYWLNHLPFTDHQKAAGIIFKVIQTLRAQNLADIKWFNLLERFHLAIDTVAVSARLEILHAESALDVKHERSERINCLQHELANCYADIVEQLGKKGDIHISVLATAAYRCLYHLGELQKYYYQLYSDVPIGFWKTVYRVYQIANEHRLNSYPFVLPQIAESCVTLDDYYKHLLLLSAANTSRLQGSEIDLISQCITSWSGHVELDKWQGQKNSYAVNIKSDIGPLWLDERRHEITPTDLLVLDLTALNFELMRLANILDRIPEGEIDLEGKMLTRNLVQRLLQVWHNKPVRRYSRIASEGAMKLYLDLEDNSHKDLCVDDWEIINSSASGFCLAKQNDVPADLYVGKWLRLKGHTLGEMPHVGIVRWLQRQAQGIQVGIEIVQQECVPVDVSASTGKGSSQGWLIEKDEANDGVFSLIIPTHYHYGELVHVKQNDQTCAMRLGKKLEHNAKYSKFQVHRVDGK